MDLDAKLLNCEEATNIPKIHIKELILPAKIMAARKVQTKFNHAAILLEVITADGERRVTFLPARFLNTLTNEDLEQLTQTKRYSVKCTGTVGKSPNVLIFKN
jgi:hypothetical protein